MQQFYKVDSVTGAGKTRAALDCAAETPTVNYVVVMPTKRLIGRAIKDLKERRPAVTKQIKAIYSSRIELGLVTGQIAEFLKTVNSRTGGYPVRHPLGVSPNAPLAPPGPLACHHR